MSITSDAFGAVPADAGVTAEAVETIPSDSSPDTPETPETEGGASTAAVEVEPTGKPGPVPYERFHEVNERRKALEADQATYGQLKQIYDQVQSDPARAADAFDYLAQSLRRGHPGDEFDVDSMTDTERRLHERMQRMEQTVAHTQKGSEAVQDSVSRRELTDAMTVLGREAKEKDWPFDAAAVEAAMKHLDLEGLSRTGVSMEDMARLAYKTVAFDAMQEVVRKQTYAAQQKKAGAQLAPATSKGGRSTLAVGSVKDAVDAAFKKLGIPDT